MKFFSIVKENFNAVVFTGNEKVGNKGFITYHKQTNLVRLKRFLDTKYPNWLWLTKYNRKTNEKELVKR